MKLSLNLGCGDRYVEGWVNVDHGSPHRKDLDVDLTDELPWESGSVSRIYAGHLLEHLSEADAQQLIDRLRVLMDPSGGVMVAVGPDVDVAREMVVNGTFDHSWGTLESIVHGAGRWAGDVHLWETTGPRVAAMFITSGWRAVHDMRINQLENGWPVADASQLWQYAVRAWVGPEST